MRQLRFLYICGDHPLGQPYGSRAPTSRRDRIRAVTPAKEKPIFQCKRWVSKGLKALRGILKGSALKRESRGAKPLWQDC